MDNAAATGASRIVSESGPYQNLPYPEAPVGIGGWLLLVLLHLVVNVKDSVEFLREEPWDDWRGLFSGQTSDLTDWPVLYVSSTVLDVVLLGLALTSLVLVFRKSRFAPRFLIAFYLSLMVPPS